MVRQIDIPFNRINVLGVNCPGINYQGVNCKGVIGQIWGSIVRGSLVK